MKEVIILGCGNTQVHCPYDKETWGVNGVYTFAKRLDKLFIVDRINDKEFDLDDIRKLPCIVASVPYPGWTNIEVYPLKQVLERFRTRFFSNAICYMMAYALLYGYERIWFYGIDMMTYSTYVMEKGGVEYWMGIAHALGVPVINTDDSATGRTIDGKMYGYWQFPEGWKKEPFPESLAEDTRRLLQDIPGVKDDSDEWEQKDGVWARRSLNIIRHPGDPKAFEEKAKKKIEALREEALQ